MGSVVILTVKQPRTWHVRVLFYRVDFQPFCSSHETLHRVWVGSSSNVCSGVARSDPRPLRSPPAYLFTTRIPANVVYTPPSSLVAVIQGVGMIHRNVPQRKHVPVHTTEQSANDTRVSHARRWRTALISVQECHHVSIALLVEKACLFGTGCESKLLCCVSRAGEVDVTTGHNSESQ